MLVSFVMESGFIGFELLDKGGLVMYLLLLLSLYTLAIVIYKIMDFVSNGIYRHYDIDKISTYLENGDAESIRKASKDNTCLGRMLSASLKLTGMQSDTKLKLLEIERLSDHEFDNIFSHLNSLQLVAAISPLAGLLGTVLGMVEAFSVIAESDGGQLQPSMLAGGIWEALLTTVVGLIIAIPTLGAYHHLSNRAELFRIKMMNIMEKIGVVMLHNNNSV